MRKSRDKQKAAGTADAKRAVLYCRVSTEHQAAEGVSLDAQKARAQAWCEASGYAVVGVFVDAGLSGKRADNRPELQEALSAVCDAGGALVVYSLSRLARSVKDTISITERLAGCGADLVSLTENIDTTSAAGKMVYRMLAVLAEFERDLVSERTKAALGFKRANGEKTGGDVPYGYQAVEAPRRGRAVKVLEPEPKEQKAIALACQLRAEGKKLREVAEDLHRRGFMAKAGGKWDLGTLRRLILRESKAAAVAV